ncbi:MAG TPA: extracellular solute-binding protein [Devosiaceae bacterium]|nr:extracellular solute-binding protein [Devosiaceae bacterium]
MRIIVRAAFAAAVGLAGMGDASAQSGTVNIYSYREPGLIAPLLDRFEAETGITPVVLFGGDGLIERLAAEGDLSPADLILTVDVGNLAAAKAQRVSQPIDPALLAAVPAPYRDPEGHWTALSLRARVFYVSKTRVAETALDYADIAGPEWRGRVCTRSGQHPYNIGLIASRIAHMGLDGARDWLAAVRDNLARAPTGSDRAQVQAIYAGECDLAIGNTYYMGLMLNNDAEPAQKQWAGAVRIVYPDAGGDGTHVNVSGVILARNAPNKANAERLIGYLLSAPAQAIYAETNYEFPVLPGVPPSDLVAGWGTLQADTTPLIEIAGYRDAASTFVDETGFDQGPRD